MSVAAAEPPRPRRPGRNPAASVCRAPYTYARIFTHFEKLAPRPRQLFPKEAYPEISLQTVRCTQNLEEACWDSCASRLHMDVFVSIFHPATLHCHFHYDVSAVVRQMTS